MSDREIGNPAGPSSVNPVMQPPPLLIEPGLSGSGPGVRERLITSRPPTSPPDVELQPEPEAVAVVASASAEFSEFYRSHWQPIARGLAVTLGDRDLAAEATDEAMARAFPRWTTLRTYDNPAGWVYRVGLNWARSYHRRIARMIPFVHHDTVDLDPVADPAIRDALMSLGVHHRSVVVCRLLLDWSVDETAAALEINAGTVKSRLHRALSILESKLADQR